MFLNNCHPARNLLVFLLICGPLFFSVAFSQDFLGYSGSNYAGVSGIDLNPASIADSRYKFDMTLLGANSTVANNYIGISKLVVKNSKTAFNDTSFQDKYMIERIAPYNKRIFVSQQAVAPSFMITRTPKDAFAITVRARSMFNVDGLEPELASLIYHNLDDPINWKKDYVNEKLSIQTMTWMEIGGTYARVLKDANDQFFKVGGRLKMLQGMNAAYLYVENLNYNFSNDTVVSISNTDVNYGHSSNFTLDSNMVNDFSASKVTMGLDLGVVYEWRPGRETKYRYDMDGKTGIDMRYKDKYKLRVGFSILDIGRIKFEKSTVGNFHVNVQNWPIDSLKSDTATSPVGNLDSVIASTFDVTESVGAFKMNLPTAFSLQADYHIRNYFYLNFTAFFALQFPNNIDKVHDITTFSLTPRWDHKWFGVFMPISYNALRNASMGFATRLGPVILGTTNLSYLLRINDVYGASVYFLLKIPVMYGRKKDRDKDKVSDAKDKCIDVPGTWEFLGCPDRDGDHVADNKDECPDIPGLPDHNGCPDRDGDKLIDKKDSCPDIAGLLELHGCPDSDGDKIIDKLDSCPGEPGLAQHFGCPDTDHDMVIDRRDSCPNDSGVVVMNGCPDTDLDGVLNKDDRCVDKPGPKENEGCPLAKLHLLDKQGNIIATATVDAEGKFTFTALPTDESSLLKLESYDVLIANEVTVITGKLVRIARKGADGYFHFENLPTDKDKLGKMDIADVQIKLKKEEAEKVKRAMETLEFDFGSDVIRSSSTDALDLVAELLMQNHNWRLKLSGHTDNVSTLKYNMNLSKKRVESIKKYLVKKGVSPDHVVLKWYGPSKPIAPNDTEEGRQKNRRVEFLIIQ